MKPITVNDVERTTYLNIPMLLFNDHFNKELSITAKVLYTVLRGRIMESLDKGIADADGDVYVVYDVISFCEDYGATEDDVIQAYFQLENADLIFVQELSDHKRVFMTTTFDDY